MIAILVAAFVLYLYAPHLLFKYAAATKYDLITRKDLPQIEEFFAAGLPSLFLNVVTWLALFVSRWCVGAAPIIVDRLAVSRAFTKDPDLSAYVRSGDVRALLCYVGALTVLSWWAGRYYGSIVRGIALAGGDADYVRAARKRRIPTNEVAALIRLGWRTAELLYCRFWRLFYAQYEHPLYPVVLRNSYAFVHTTRGLFHGILFQFDKKRDGDIEGIVLIGVSRFSRKTEEESLRLGLNPITDLSGPLFIKWAEIIDINYPPDETVLAAKRAFYEQKIKERGDAKPDSV